MAMSGATSGAAASDYEPEHTVFYLSAGSTAASEAIAHKRNKHYFVDTANYGPALRITLDHRPRDPRILVQIGNGDDVDIFVEKADVARCAFVFNGESGELLMRDMSDTRSTTMDCSEGNGPMKSIKTASQSQAAIVFTQHPVSEKPRLFVLKLAANVTFCISPPVQGAHIPLEKKQRFCTEDGIRMSWQQGVATPYFTTGDLGGGTEACVKTVAATQTGSYFACKTVFAGKKGDKRHKRVTESLDLMIEKHEAVKASYIVPYLNYYSQGTSTLELIMPVYWCNLADLIDGGLFRDGPSARYRASQMFLDISTALGFMASLDTPLLHRDIKPENILYRDGHFYLADFGCSKLRNQTSTSVGTILFQSPESRYRREQTPAMDIFSLGLTLAVCLMDAEDYTDIIKWCGMESMWHEECTDTLARSFPIGGIIFETINNDPSMRPDARAVKNAAEALLRANKPPPGYQGPTEEECKLYVNEHIARQDRSLLTVPGPKPTPAVRTSSSFELSTATAACPVFPDSIGFAKLALQSSHSSSVEPVDGLGPRQKGKTRARISRLFKLSPR